ncbi:hypothetical protein FMN63_06370 [Stappia sp. BW2]|jgi:hypothetical protein|uniref:hypothetical protein n=1 Tax=Stappia sp. BW2 TaxID=2592622 RepID=UPI0011DEA5CC|nr:hypothetical protein [Stappia sp. BW2]TYC75469.1 hypothetical protein FMN63_06370 [Stappia sp. BW2]
MTIFVNPWLFLIWVLASWVIGVLGRDTRFGFVGNFLIAFVFSPLVGIIVLLAADRWRRPSRDRKRRKA